MFVPTVPFTTLGFDNTGTVDITASFNAAIAQGGKFFLPTGSYKVSGPIKLSKNYTSISGGGFGTIIQPTASFIGANVFAITGSYCVLENMSIAPIATLWSTNAVADGIQITGSTASRIENILLTAINGWQLVSTGGASNPNYNTVLKNIRGYQCKNGFHLLGTAGSGYGGIHFVSDCYANQTQVGDCWFIEDFLDLEAVNIFGENAAVVGASGYSLHIKGNCNALFFSNFDLGPYPGPGGNHVVLIESDANGNPGHITFNGGIIEGGQGAGVNLTAGFNIAFNGTHFFNNGTYGVNILGGDAITFNTCTWDSNGSSLASSGKYDVQVTTTGTVSFDNCYYRSFFGTTPGQINAVVNKTDVGFCSFENCQFKGTGFLGGNIFASYPSVIRGCVGFNPIGNIGAPAITSSPYTSAVQSVDYTAYISLGSSVITNISIGGTTIGLTGAAALRIAAGQTFSITYTTANPSQVWIGD